MVCEVIPMSTFGTRHMTLTVASVAGELKRVRRMASLALKEIHTREEPSADQKAKRKAKRKALRKAQRKSR
jgi:hypothetical protein